MQQTPPPQLPWHTPELPAAPAIVPMVPARLRQPGPQPPLPDPAAVCRFAVPDPAPPYDDEEPCDRQRPPAPDAGAAAAASSAARAADQRSAESASPCWPSQFAQVLAETLAGSRSAQQLTPWTTEQARQKIKQLGPMLVTDQRPRVRRIVTSAPSQDVLELTAVVGFGPRVRALAVRLERAEGRPYRTTGPNRTAGERWCCTAIESA